MPAPIVVRIGGSVDSSVAASFNRIRKGSVRLQNDLNGATSRGVSNAKRAERTKEDIFKRGNRKRAAAAERAVRDIERGHQREVRAAKRAEQKKTADAISEARKRERAVNRAAARRGERFASRTSQRASRFLTPNAPIGSLARRAGSEVLRGAGVDVSAGSQISKFIRQEDLATKLSTKAFRPKGTGRAAERQDVGRLRKDARAVAQSAGVSTGAVLEGQFAFTSQSGDLLAAEQISERLAKLAASQGADMQDAFFAAGKINNALEAQPEFAGDDKSKERVEEVLNVVRLLTAQTKIGSIEFDNLAKQLPKIAGLSGLFVGGTKSSLGELATVLQVAEKGQAPNAAVAATQVSNLATELQKGAVQKRFKAEGIDVIDEPSGKAIPIRQVITQLLVKASQARERGDVTSEGAFITNIVRNKRTFLPFFDFLDQFKQAGGLEKDETGTAKGVAKLDKLFSEFGKSLSKEQEAGDIEAHQRKTSTRVQQFNTELEKVTEKVAGKLLPALEKSGPAFLSFAEKLGNLTTWAVENPKAAIGAAITASIARAGMESMLRAGIERAILGPHGGVAGQLGAAPGGGRAGRIGRVAGVVGGAATFASIAVTTLVVGTMLIDEFLEGRDKEREQNASQARTFEQQTEAQLSKRDAANDPERRKKFLEAEQKRTHRELVSQQGIVQGFGEFGSSQAIGNNILRAFGDEGQADAEIRTQTDSLKRLEAVAESQRVELAAILERIAENTAEAAANVQPGATGQAGVLEKTDF